MECLLTCGEEKRGLLEDVSCKTSFQLRRFIPAWLGLPACQHLFSSVFFSSAVEGFWHSAGSVNPWKHLEKVKQWEGWSSSSSCAGLGSWCPRAQARAQLQPAGAKSFLLICTPVHSTATIFPEGCVNPLPHWWMTSTTTTCVKKITCDSVNLNKLKAFDNTVYFRGVLCFLQKAQPRSQGGYWKLLLIMNKWYEPMSLPCEL